MSDRRVNALVLGGTARLLYVDATGLAQETAARHGLKGRAKGVAAEMVVANGLLAAWIKGDERIMLQLQGEKPRMSFLGEMDAVGQFRGRFSPAWIMGDGLAVRGMMLAIKSNAEAEMYRGITAVDGETVAAALTRHLAQSDQVEAAVRIDVAVEDGEIIGAVGLVMERLPVGGEAEIADFRRWSKAAQALTPVQLVEQIEDERMADEPLDVLELWPLRFQCRCSRPKVEGMLLGLGADTLRAMRDEDHGASITCDFCAEVYALDEGELDRLLGRLEAEA